MTNDLESTIGFVYINIIERAKALGLPTDGIRLFIDAPEFQVAEYVALMLSQNPNIISEGNGTADIYILDPAWGKPSPAAYRHPCQKHQNRPPWRRRKRG